MGLTDIGSITEKVLGAVLEADTGASVDVVVGSRASSLSAVHELAAQHTNVSVYVDAADIGSLMVDADLAVGAAGATTWERCCLGLPTITVVLADNQRIIGDRLAAVEAIVLVNDFDIGKFSAMVANLVADRQRLKMISLAAAQITDGMGAQKVVSSLTSSRQQCGSGAHNL